MSAGRLGGAYSVCAHLLCSLCTHGQLGRCSGGAGRCIMMYKATGVWDEALTAAVDDSGPLRQPHKQPPPHRFFAPTLARNWRGVLQAPHDLVLT